MVPHIQKSSHKGKKKLADCSPPVFAFLFLPTNPKTTTLI
jgi:hypothetical protein